LNRKLKILIIAAGVLIAPVLLSPMPRFRDPLSTVVEARDGSLLGARIAADGQWRFPGLEKVPDKFEKALLTFEDRWFYYHPGINPVSIARALAGNIKAGTVVSGGSTITMQVSRMSGGNRRRTYPRKIQEMLSALKLELFHSKKTILLLHASNAPFGGNTVGLEAAAWRYTGKSSDDLTWAEAATLAILPNSASLVYPGKNQELLKTRRDALLKRMFERGFIDSLTLILARDEQVPGEHGLLPAKAPHLTDNYLINARGKRIRTTIDPILQDKASEIINNHQRDLSGNFIFNSACIVVEVESGKVLAYVGNSNSENGSKQGAAVDIIRAERSSGSILKPLLYAAMQQSGDLLPNSLVADIPTRFSGFAPSNFDQSYSGAVTASSALSQSLNIPAVKMLQQYNPGRFLDLLRKTGFTSFGKTADHYGLSLILGGGETSLWELSGVYASLSRVLKRYQKEGRYYIEDYHEPLLVLKDSTSAILTEDKEPPLSASSIWLTYEALQQVNRPESESGWQYFSSSPSLAWKTGTSFGFRDGWAVGTTPKYVVAVWTGNADGEGRPGLTGITCAAPILFELVNYMGSVEWFKKPEGELTMITVCSRSGFRAGPDCPETVETEACINGLRGETCPYHRIIHLNRQMTMQVSSDCADPAEITNVPWFVLPPAMEYFYRQKNQAYRVLPPLAPGCVSAESIPVMEFIYPTRGTRIFIPRDETGYLTRMVAETVHRNPAKKIFWHLDEKFIATTRSIHQTEILAAPGNHVLTAVDEDGNSIKCAFNIIGR